MTALQIRTRLALGVVLAAICLPGTALADKPEGKGKGKGHERSEQRQDNARDDDHRNREKGRLPPGAGSHFHDQHRVHVRAYYGNEHRRGHCPPGLAKKHNGCMPPGQAKKWQIGKPIPRDVVYYDLPQPLVVQIGAPPAGYRYVRAAADILLIAVGTGIVIDAIQDLGRL